MTKKVFLPLLTICVGLAVLGSLFFHRSESGLGSASSTDVCPYLFVSWNVLDLGRSKSDESIKVIVEVLKDAHIVALQEVTAGKDFGAQAVVRLKDELSRKGSAWDYVVSKPTSGQGSERYAYLVRKGVTFSRDDAHLLKGVEDLIDREPYRLRVHSKQLTEVDLLTIHAVPTKKDPVLEIMALGNTEVVKSSARIILSGDFNLPGRVTDKVFEPLGYRGHIREKTSIKRSIDGQGGHLLHQYDNIYTKGVHVCSSGVIDFVDSKFTPVTNDSLKEARKVSDHLPVFIWFR